jgi:hypothetical protein
MTPEPDLRAGLESETSKRPGAGALIVNFSARHGRMARTGLVAREPDSGLFSN